MTTQTPIQLFTEAVERGLKLSFEPPFSLVVEPAERCPDDFADTLSQHKRQLLDLLRLPFVMLFSQTLGETIFFCEDDQTKAALTRAGACEWSIYTRAELEILVEQNRIKPFSADELRKLHKIKRTFHGRIIP
jgi:hypothetical protein